MDIRPLKTARDYTAALERIDGLLDAELNTPRGDELDVLTTLVEAYERTHFSIEAPDPVEFIKNVMEFRDVGQSEFAALLKSRSRASEILRRQRPLTLAQIRTITEAWQLPADSLISEYEVGV